MINLHKKKTLVSLGKPSFKKSAVFFNIVQKAFDPPPPLFEHLSYFAGGVFENAFLSIKNGSNNVPISPPAK